MNAGDTGIWRRTMVSSLVFSGTRQLPIRWLRGYPLPIPGSSSTAEGYLHITSQQDFKRPWRNLIIPSQCSTPSRNHGLVVDFHHIFNGPFRKCFIILGERGNIHWVNFRQNKHVVLFPSKNLCASEHEKTSRGSRRSFPTSWPHQLGVTRPGYDEQG